MPAAPAQETKKPDGEETAAPQEGVPAEKPVETEEDPDALLSEIRDLLADSPVPKLGPEQLKKPPQPVPEVSIPDTAPVPRRRRPQRMLPRPVPPRRVLPRRSPRRRSRRWRNRPFPSGEIPSQEIGQDAGQAPAEQVPASVFDEQPTQVIPTQEIAEEMQAQEEAAPRRSCSRRFVRPGSRPPGTCSRPEAGEEDEEKGRPQCGADPSVSGDCGSGRVYCGAQCGAGLPGTASLAAENRRRRKA